MQHEVTVSHYHVYLVFFSVFAEDLRFQYKKNFTDTHLGHLEPWVSRISFTLRLRKNDNANRKHKISIPFTTWGQMYKWCGCTKTFPAHYLFIKEQYAARTSHILQITCTHGFFLEPSQWNEDDTEIKKQDSQVHRAWICHHYVFVNTWKPMKCFHVHSVFVLLFLIFLISLCAKILFSLLFML